MGPRAGLDGRKISSPPGFDPGNERKYKTLCIINSQYLSEVKSVGLFNTLRPKSKQQISTQVYKLQAVAFKTLCILQHSAVVIFV